MNIQLPSYDTEAFARIVLYQLASLRAEGIQTQSIVTQILCHEKDENHQRYIQRIEDQEARKAVEIDRLYREMMKASNLSESPIPKSLDSTPPTPSGYSKN